MVYKSKILKDFFKINKKSYLKTENKMKKQTNKTERPSPYGVRLSNKHRKLLKTKAKKDGVSMHAFCLTHLTILAES